MRYAGLLGALLLGAALVLWWRTEPPDGHGLRLLPDTGRPIAAVAVSLASARRSTLRNAAVVSTLLAALPAAVDVYALTNDRAAFALAPGANGRVPRFVDLPTEHSFTIWPQDPFLVLVGEGGHTELLLSAHFDRADDALMARELARVAGLPLRRSALTFEGGNIVADERRAYVGANTIRVNALAAGKSDRDIARAFERELGLPVLVIGALPQPVAHIDMMLTPLGDDHVALADLRAGVAVARRALESEPGTVARFERVTGATYFGLPGLRAVDTRGGARVEAPDLAGATARVLANARAAVDYLDVLAARLQERGLRVSRIPMLFDAAAPESGEDESRRLLPYPMLSYNNVLVEHRDGRPVVYLPQYGFEALDRAARDAWHALGFEVRAVHGYASSALHGGALRCGAKVLARGRSVSD